MKKKILQNINKTDNVIDSIFLARHPYTCAITGAKVDRPCWECIIYHELDENCQYRPVTQTEKKQNAKY